MLLRKLLKTAWKYKAQFISMIIMVAIGIGVFVGFNMEWYSLQKDTNSFFNQTNYADYRIISEEGFSESDILAVKKIEGITAASRVLSVNVDVKNEDKSLALFAVEDYIVSTMYIMDGKDYDPNNAGFWLSDKYAMENHIKLGDTITITYRNVEISGEVVGLIKSGEFMVCVADNNQLMPDFSSFGFVYVAPNKLKNALNGSIFYSQIHVLSNIDKSQIENEIKLILNKTTLVLNKSEHISYAAAQSEIEEGKTMVSVLPLLFLLIGVLTMITTMHRITANEKIQIGTLKALGFKNKKILWHYTSYGLVIGIIGAIIGVILGIGLCVIVINPNGMMGTYMDLPSWKVYIQWWTWIIVLGVIAFLTFISFISVKKMLKGTAAETLRPYIPKKVKPLVIEKVKLWNKLSFSTKWNLRDIVRHKTRSIMTLIGIIGCMILLVGGLGMRDTMTGFLNTLDKQILNYETRVNFAEAITNKQAIEFTESYNGDYVATLNVQVNNDPIMLEIYNIKHDTIRFISQKNAPTTLLNNGAYISLRVAKRGYKIGDMLTFSPYGSKISYDVKIIGILRSYMSENIVLTSDFADSIKIPYTISSAFFNMNSNGIETTEFIAGMQSKTSIMDSYNSFMEIMSTMVLMFVIAAIILGIVVLYNLGVMNYVERYRELATLKVVGFQNKHIGKILISQNIWITILGIILGLPAGIGILQLLITLLASEYELKMILGVLTYGVSIFLTFGVSFIVSLLIANKNKKINMVEALKEAE